jgi:hypothetical protein
MIGRLMHWIGEAAGSIATKYALRASVVVPFALAAGFGTAGLTVYLSELIGHRDAYFSLAAGFAVLGVLAGLIVRWREKHEQQKADGKASEHAAASSIAGAAKIAVSLPAGLMEGPAETRGSGGQWTARLKSWPLYVLAIALLLIASQSRSGYARDRIGRF